MPYRTNAKPPEPPKKSRVRALAGKLGETLLVGLILVVVPPIRLLMGLDPFDF
jgi:hypothetical protein